MAIAVPSVAANLLSATATTTTSYISLAGLVPSGGTGIVIKNTGTSDVFLLGGLGNSFTVNASATGAYRLGAGSVEEFNLPEGIDNIGIRTASGSTGVECAIGRGIV